MAVSSKHFGVMPDGRSVTEYTIGNPSGASVSLLDYGAVIRSITVPDSKGVPGDVVLGFDTIGEYISNSAYIGAIVGRYGNRIANAQFMLNGKLFKLDRNDGDNSLHGGRGGFHTKLWDAEIKGGDTVRMTYTSADMEEGYPGNLTVRLDYILSDDNALMLEYQITTDADTIHNVTNHAYFNLDGHDHGSIAGHGIRIAAGYITPVSSPACITTGEMRSVAGTVFDLREPGIIGEMMEKGSGDEQMVFGRGYDINFVISGEGFRECAVVTGAVSGRKMEVRTDHPGIQFYSGNMLPDMSGKGGAKYGYRGAFCLETQHYPDSINHPEFPPVILRAGDVFRSKTEYRFGII